MGLLAWRDGYLDQSPGAADPSVATWAGVAPSLENAIRVLD